MKARTGKQLSGVPGIPGIKRVKLTYCDSYAIATDTSVQATAIVRANGPYDPDFAVGGHQPLGFDQWAAFYNNVVVESSDIEAVFKTTAASSSLVQYGILLSDDDTVPASPAAMAEQPYDNHVFGANDAGAKSIVTVRHHFDAMKFFALKNVLDNRYDVGSLVSTTPTQEALFVIYMGLAIGTATSFSTSVSFMITYNCVFSEPKALAQS